MIKSGAPIVAAVAASLLAMFKFSVGFLSGSISILASAIDSLLDSFISVINFFALKKSNDSPNRKFNYGFGKIEGLVALFEGLFIASVGVFLIYKSIEKLFIVESYLNFDIAIAVMLVSIFTTIFLIWYLSKEAKRTNSLIIKSDLLHYKSDFIANAGIIFALVAIKITGYEMIDSGVGILIGFYIIYSAYELANSGISTLLDRAIEDEVIDKIKQTIGEISPIKSFHDLKSRKVVNDYFLSLHLVFSPDIRLQDAHDIGDKLEGLIRDKFSDKKWFFEIHFDPREDL